MQTLSLSKIKGNKVLLSALILSFGTFTAKLIGAIYRIPLTNILGAEGLGLYQMIFPLYCILLDFSGSGVPNALSKIIAQGYEKKKVLFSSVKFFRTLGLIGTLFMLVFSYLLAYLQGNDKAFLGYIALSPSVFLVSVICCYRGYFQGEIHTLPIAISQVIEQVVKLGVGLGLAYLLSSNVTFGVSGATFAVTASELVALFYLVLTYKRREKERLKTIEKAEYKKYLKIIIGLVIPVTLIGIALPLCNLTDSFIIVNVLKTYREDAVKLYGLFTGAVSTVINLPVAVCYGISAVTIPWITKSKTQKNANGKSFISIFVTLGVSAVFSIALYFLSETAVRILFARLTENEKATAILLLKTCSVNVVLLSSLQTVNAVLIGKGRPYLALIGLGAGLISRITVNLILLPNAYYNIYAGAYASITCYFVALLVNLITVVVITEKGNRSKSDGDKERKNRRKSYI